MRFFLVLLLGICLTLSPVFGQTIENYRSAVEQIRLELLRSKTLLTTLNDQVLSLENNLIQANEEQQNLARQIEHLELSLEHQGLTLLNLEQLQRDLELTISGLEDSLNLAQLEQRRLVELVSSLESQLTALLESLKDSEAKLIANEEKHVEQIENLSVGYERRILIHRIGIIALIAVLIEEAVRHLLQSKD